VDKAFVIIIAAMIVIVSIMAFFVMVFVDIVDEPVESLILTENTKWTEKESPYVFNQDVIVEEGIRLTIEPGVEVRFEKYRKPARWWVETGLTVMGTLYAVGLPTKLIKFTVEGDHDDRWNGITIESTSIDSQLRNCLIQEALIGVDIKSASTLVRDNTFKDNRYALTANAHNVEIFNNVFDSNLCGVYAYFDCTIANNLIKDNQNGVECTGWSGTGPEIYNNTMYRNKGIGVYSVRTIGGKLHDNLIGKSGKYGIYLTIESSWDIYNNDISNSTQSGIFVEGSTARIANNSIKNSGEHGIDINEYIERGPEDVPDPEDIHYPSNVTITSNDISGNLVGVYIDKSLAEIHYNNIFQNQDKGVVNAVEALVDAVHNWWGTTDGDAIAAMIEGNVIYVPCLETRYDN
jgi:hypothetical protein